MKTFVIVPTLNKNTLSRSLNSISTQTESATQIVVVFEEENKTPIVDSDANYLLTKNRRTKNRSGAINHAVDEIISRRFEWDIVLEDTWLTLLDDDDWWEPDFLENCIGMAKNDVHQVICGIILYDLKNPSGIFSPVPTHLDASSFLIKNPNIQGSNLFVRMDAFLEAGGFDESLQSCTDRDFCIRLFERSHHKCAIVEKHLVHHDARISGRISDSGSPRELQGLRRFAMKHQFIMDDDEWREFQERIITKFALNPKTESQHGPDNIPHKAVKSGKWNSVRTLTVGVTLGSLQFAARFILSYGKLIFQFNHPVKLVICLHGITYDEIQHLIESAELENSDITVHEEEWGHLKGIGGKLGPWFLHKSNRNGVSWGRCVLHHAIWLETNTIKKPLIWILDDDIIFKKKHLKQISDIADEMDSKGFTVGVGHVVGDPPLMPIYTVRTQLIDCYYAKLSKQYPHRNRVEFEQIHFHEMHHDLSTNRTDHLEFPLGFHAAIESDEQIESILQGKGVTRRVHSGWASISEVPARGGNTLLLDSEPLCRWSNVAPNCGGIQFRRGDTLWSKWVALENEDSICSIPLAVSHIRSISNEANYEMQSIRGDIAGSMLVRQIQGLNSISGVSDPLIPFNVLSESIIREARLISNLKRVEFLMILLGIDGEILEKIQLLTVSLLKKDWPKEFTHDLGKFLDEINTSMHSFNCNQRAQSNY